MKKENENVNEEEIHTEEEKTNAKPPKKDGCPNAAENGEENGAPGSDGVHAAEIADRYIRLLAEYDNYRKRSEKEKSETYRAGMAFAVTAFLPLLDNLDRALLYEPENEGAKLICKQVKDIFEKLGVEEIISDGAPFDPEFHNAVAHEEDPGAGENLVAETFQKGYAFCGKMIRHAVVKVVN